MKSSSELKYDNLYIGFKFPSVSCKLDREIISLYLKATEDESSLYSDESIVPPMTVAIYGRLGYILNMTKFDFNLPKGLIHAKQMYKFNGIVKGKDVLTTYTEVVDRYTKNDRKYIIIEMITKNKKKEIVIIGRMTIIWTV